MCTTRRKKKDNHVCVFQLRPQRFSTKPRIQSGAQFVRPPRRRGPFSPRGDGIVEPVNSCSLAVQRRGPLAMDLFQNVFCPSRLAAESQLVVGACNCHQARLFFFSFPLGPTDVFLWFPTKVDRDRQEQDRPLGCSCSWLAGWTGMEVGANQYASAAGLGWASRCETPWCRGAVVLFRGGESIDLIRNRRWRREKKARRLACICGGH